MKEPYSALMSSNIDIFIYTSRYIYIYMVECLTFQEVKGIGKEEGFRVRVIMMTIYYIVIKVFSF